MKLFPGAKLNACPAPSRTNIVARASLRAFTMIEIAISLAVVGFALAAIMGVLPLGMNVQKTNRQETIINQDGQVLMDAIRNGARGFDDLTNYVIAITNVVSGFNAAAQYNGTTLTYGYTLTNSSTASQYPLNSGLRIIGLLSTPTYVPTFDSAGNYTGFISNRVMGYFRAMSGPASEKFPQNNPDVRDFSFNYRVVPEVVYYWTNYFDPSWQVHPDSSVTDTNILIEWTNQVRAIAIMQTNFHDIRLNYRWPLLARSAPGPGQQAFVLSVAGLLMQTNEPGFIDAAYNLYFFQPQTYTNNLAF